MRSFPSEAVGHEYAEKSRQSLDGDSMQIA